jgi:hypothetical protein
MAPIQCSFDQNRKSKLGGARLKRKSIAVLGTEPQNASNMKKNQAWPLAASAHAHWNPHQSQTICKPGNCCRFSGRQPEWGMRRLNTTSGGRQRLCRQKRIPLAGVDS